MEEHNKTYSMCLTAGGVPAKLSRHGAQVSRLRCWNMYKQSRASGTQRRTLLRRIPNTSRRTTQWISSPAMAGDPIAYAIVSAYIFSWRLGAPFFAYH